VIFFNNVGYLGMCGHGTMGLVVTLAHLGRIGVGHHRIETPVGVVSAELHDDGSVTVANVPSYMARQDVCIEVQGMGQVVGDVAWGGNWFFLVSDHGQALELDNVNTLTDFTWAVRKALEAAGIRGKGDAIIDHVELIRNLVNEFSTFARFPTADPKPCRLAPIIEETVSLYREGHPDIAFDIQIADDIPKMNLDRQQFKQAMIILVDNAVSAVRNQGQIAICAAYDPILKIARLEVADDGTGITDADKIRLFEPNFSTKKAGMGLGLTIVNSIVTDHHGMIRVQDNLPKGAKFVIELPV
jgi:signal transduction histidine kinase